MSSYQFMKQLLKCYAVPGTTDMNVHVVYSKFVGLLL